MKANLNFHPSSFRLLPLLDGIRVLDLSRLLPGAYATQMLVDMGAEVIKVERPPEGDYLRMTPPVIALDDERLMGAVFAQVNRGKKSVGINFTKPRGRELLLKLVATADVFIESFRPGALARRGLDYKAVGAVNPRLVYCSLSGYGRDGAYRDRAGHDLNYIALAGILNLNAHANQIPVPPPVQIADLSGAMLATVQILAALVERARTNVGKYLDVALYDAPLAWMQTIIGAHYQATRANPERGQLWLSSAYPCYGVYETADGGFMSLAALEPQFWKGFCEAIGRDDLIERHLDADAIPRVREIFRSRSRAEWIEFAQRADVCLEPCLTVSEALNHPQARMRLNGDDKRRVPMLGEDTVEVLCAMGLDAREIEKMEQEGIVAT